MRLIILLSLFSTCIVANANDAASDGIQVFGTGHSEVKPDIATLNLTVATLDKSASKSQQLNAKIADKVISKLKSFDVAGKDIQTSNFYVSPEYDYQSHGRILKGHRVQHSYNVILRRTNKLGVVLDALTEAGAEALSIGSINFGLSDKKELELKSLKLAVANAKEKAEVLAKASQQKLGRIIAVHEVSNAGPMPVARMEMMKSSAASRATSVESGEVSVVANVLVHFELN